MGLGEYCALDSFVDFGACVEQFMVTVAVLR